jgi:hypothetical protein
MGHLLVKPKSAERSPAFRKEKKDAEQLVYAVNQGRTLLTHNRIDFETLAKEYFAAGKIHPGIIIAARRSPTEIVRQLLLILNRVTSDEMQNQLRYI